MDDSFRSFESNRRELGVWKSWGRGIGIKDGVWRLRFSSIDDTIRVYENSPIVLYESWNNDLKVLIY
jgi:hypothetical protein